MVFVPTQFHPLNLCCSIFNVAHHLLTALFYLHFNYILISDCVHCWGCTNTNHLSIFLFLERSATLFFSSPLCAIRVNHQNEIFVGGFKKKQYYDWFIFALMEMVSVHLNCMQTNIFLFIDCMNYCFNKTLSIIFKAK